MNKFITMLILGVVAAAMLLVLGMHVRQLPGEEAQSPSEIGSLAENGETVGEGLPRGTLPEDDADISSSLRAPVRPPADTATTPPDQAQPAQGTPPAAVADGAGPAVIPVQSGTDASPRPAPGPAPSPATTRPAVQPSAQPTRQVPATASVSRGRGSIVEVSLQFRGRGMVLVIEGDGPLPARHFLLANPERLVVDLPGSWRNLKAPSVPSNNLVKSVRLGRQDDADRLVLDLKTKLKSSGINRINDRKVEVLFN